VSGAAAGDGARRVEHDLLGDKEVPAAAYYGIHTQRALENFPVSGVAISHLDELVLALAAVKEAAALANRDLGLLDDERTGAIVSACQEIRAGGLRDQFVVDIIQGGAGTSTNMNANEVVCNRALELLGHPKGDYARLHPLDHVNMSQSTNDVYPTAAKVAAYLAIEDLLDAMAELEGAFRDKALEFADVLCVGRTQLQDAVPMTLGQEFGAYAVTIGEDRRRLAEARALIREINLGGTAVGTGLNAPPGYREAARAHLATITGIDVETAPDLVEATQDAGVFVQLSGVLKRIAVKLSKTCNDLRLLSSGPRAGFGDIRLPPVQAGSSIMPGKVNPVIPEMVTEVAFEVIGNDVTITLAAEGGQLQLNAFEPVIVARLFNSLRRLRAANRLLAERCVRGITANRDHLEWTVRHSIGLATALNPVIGYAAATRLAGEALQSGRSVVDLALESGLVTPEQLAEVLSPDHLVGRPAPLPEPDTGRHVPPLGDSD
jgi:aspartate ammonia-lyase